MFGVAQGSILGPLLSNIFAAYLFFILSDINLGIFANDNTSYISGNNADDVIESPEQPLLSLLKLFEHSLLKGNTISLQALIKEPSLYINNFTN